jgi:acyl-[acyl-carrier-protein]-phospholipid O-acyltransferase/long-chain-fatty-acid--[acyl-carrier-protein] ligase
MFTELMASRRFAPLFWCQFCSALNDNLLKNALVMLILFGLGGAGGGAGRYAPVLVTLAGVTLIAPFFILSALGGELADRYDKARVAAAIKLAEIPMAGLAALGFYLQSVPILFLTLGLFGVVAALFGPVKYGILPEKLKTAELSAGNALVEAATFIAILGGTIAGGVAVTAASTPELVVGMIVAFAIASWMFARAIPKAGPAAPRLAITRNVWKSTFALLRELSGSAPLWAGAHITSWFWLVGSVALALLPSMVKDNLGGNEGVVTLGLATFVIGIAVGSALAARASHGTPNLALVPLGAALIGICALALGWLAATLSPGEARLGPAAVLASGSGLAVLAALCGLTIAGGLYMVPSMAAVQAWSPPERRARVIASLNVMNAAYMLTGGAIVAGLQAAGVSIAILFAVLGVLSFAAMVYVVHAWGFALNGELGRVMLRLSLARKEGAGEPSGGA